MNQKKHRVLVVDDEENIRWVLGTYLEKYGFDVHYGMNGKEATETAIKDEYSLIFLDINMPDMDGFEVLKILKENLVKTPVILITAQNTVNNAIRGIKMGAYDYITKPFDLEEIKRIAEKALESFVNATKVASDKTSIQQPTVSLEEIVGQSPQMLTIYKTIGRVADRDVTVLITGESGTGKELIAKAIHYNSKRKDNKLVSINMAAIPKELAESELFGHEKGAFTGAHSRKIGRFEEAKGGTLHIDEIGETPLDLQTKLLRVLEEKKIYRVGSENPIPIDVRIVASTNKDLKEEVKKGKFREDLYYRLNTITLSLPPLRKRKTDIPLLISRFINKYSSEFHLEAKSLSNESINHLLNYDWPGNVRELENTIKRLMVLVPDPVIEPRHLEEFSSYIFEGRKEKNTLAQTVRTKIKLLLKDVDQDNPNIYTSIMREVEKELLETVLEFTKGNKKKAASILGINRNTLSKKLTELKIDPI